MLGDFKFQSMLSAKGLSMGLGIVGQLHEPLAIFQSVFQAMVLGFTPLFGHNNLPELDLRLAVHVLTWIYERHADEVSFCIETLNVVEVLFRP